MDKLDFLIESLVKLSRLENGILELEPRKCCIRKVLSAADRQFSKKARQKGVTLTIEDSTEEAVFDLKWTIEAVGNIIDNAVKYTPKGGSVSVRVLQYPMFLRLDVADTGDRSRRSRNRHPSLHVFTVPEAVSGQPGVGIGLYFAREVDKREKGYIKVSSEPGKGSTFSVFLHRG